MTIEQKGERTTNNVFLCIVKRPSCFNVFYTPDRWESWRVLADTHEKAMDAAMYNFWRSDYSNIWVSQNPYRQYLKLN